MKKQTILIALIAATIAASAQLTLTTVPNTGCFPGLTVAADPSTSLPITFIWMRTTGTAPTGSDVEVKRETLNGHTSFFLPPSDVAGAVRYYVILQSECGTVTSVVSSLHTTEQPLAFTTNINSTAVATVCQNATAFAPIQVVVSGAGTYTFLWQSSPSYHFVSNVQTVTAGVVTSGNTSTLTPPNNAVGTLYYRVTVSTSATSPDIVSNILLCSARSFAVS